MNTDDELRAMLDERGVNWDYGITGAATTKFRANGVDLTFMPMRDGLVCTTILTPAQAIAATRGSGTCQLKRASWDDGTCTWGCICSACDAHLEHETGIGYNYCPVCGAKVVDE